MLARMCTFVGGNVKCYSCYGEKYGSFLKLKIELQYNLGSGYILPLGINPQKNWKHGLKEIFTHPFS